MGNNNESKYYKLIGNLNHIVKDSLVINIEVILIKL